MAKILLNTRASRLTLVDNILLLPAEIKDDERLGKVVKPSKTLISERGSPSPYQRIQGDRATQRLLQAKVIEWSDEKVEEPEPAPDLRVAEGLPRIDQVGKMQKRQATPEADVDFRATIDESGTPLQALSKADAAVVVTRGAAPPPPEPPKPVETTQEAGAKSEQQSGTTDRVSTDEARDALPTTSKHGKHKGG